MKKTKQTKRKSIGEETLAQHLNASKIIFQREAKFHPTRKWRVDFMLENKIAIEIEGAIWAKGRHTRPKGYIADMEKYNALAQQGYTLLRFTTDQVVKGVAIHTIVNYLREPQ